MDTKQWRHNYRQEKRRLKIRALVYALLLGLVWIFAAIFPAHAEAPTFNFCEKQPPKPFYEDIYEHLRDRANPVISTPNRAIITAYIHSKALKNGVDPELALFLAKFESNLDPYAKNPKSTAKGIYQFLDGTWKALCRGDVYDYRANIDCALGLLGADRKNLRHWSADEAVRRALLNSGILE